MNEIFIINFIIIAVIIGFISYMVYMPSASFQGDRSAAFTQAEQMVENRLRTHIATLAQDKKGRNLYQYDTLTPAKNYIAEQFHVSSYPVIFQDYTVALFSTIEDRFSLEKNEVATFTNVTVELQGTTIPHEIIVIGAHYDSVVGSPGANDNASGVAVLLELARMLQGKHFKRTIQLVAFANEEAPYFATAAMGSLAYAKRNHTQGKSIIAMFSLETIGYFSDTPHSQKYPFPFKYFYPSTGNFLAFIGNFSSRNLVKTTVATFRQHSPLPCEGVAAPSAIPDINRSDHWAFWIHGYPALMVTDTAPFRYPHYHTAQDTPDKIDYERLTRVVSGLQKVIEKLANQ